MSVLHAKAQVAFLVAILAMPGLGMAEPSNYSIAIRGHQFVPAQLELPPGAKVRLTISNEDTLPAEFESVDLSRELVVPVKQTVTVFIGPLDAGKYEFFNDFNPDMRGAIVVKSDKEK